MARTLPPFRYLTIGGSPAVAAPSAPQKRDIIGILTEAQAKYGQPASVQVVRDGLNITLYQYGPNVLPGLIAAAQRLVGTAVARDLRGLANQIDRVAREAPVARAADTIEHHPGDADARIV